ncbi:MAG: hypothetical protein AB2827_12690 [Candidatus Thiodiazotropha sp.]
MADKELIETIYGKYNKFEIMKQSGGTFGSPKFYIFKDGKSYRGPYSNLQDAVEQAKQET